MTDKLLKDQLNESSVLALSALLQTSGLNFDADKFKSLLLDDLLQLELKQRVQLICSALEQSLSDDISEQITAFTKLPALVHSTHKLSAFEAWPLIDYIGHVGIEKPELALPCLADLTQLFSAEFAIRPYIERYQDLCFEFFKLWVKSDDEHVRRLVSEGTRSRLPWAAQLPRFRQKPELLEPFLTALSCDDSAYVRKSVANNLNDISKDNAQWMLGLCHSWQQLSLDAALAERRDWVIKHACRTLVKAGNSEALALLGYSGKAKSVELKLEHTKIAWQGELNFCCVVHNSNKSLNAVLDYRLEFQRKNGRSSKVFKLKNVNLRANETVQLNKCYSFAEISTRRYYPGVHTIEILLNGDVVARQSFELEAELLLEA
ncbi:DNA alkylation repair protein [Agaribacterium haliotis]|uniref:DNA alkylation repair protein n=1 Tax=Agaribacterium haliotis TaxID=2013869 RepID=UPI000BB54546|nr:DNA alkylation repair protein [Agaribacterium haliotis]